MDKVRKPNISVSYTPSSEPYSIISVVLNIGLHMHADNRFAVHCLWRNKKEKEC
jgi:hypothetical protein